MKATKKLHCAYLYSDGHAALVWQKRDPEAGEIEWIELHEKWGNVHMRFQGRLVLHNPEAYLRLAKQAYAIEAEVGSLEHGSDNTKRLGLRVGHVAFQMSADWMRRDSIWISLLPDVLSSDFTVQPDVTEKWEDVCDSYSWGLHPVGKVHRLPKDDNAVKEAA